MTFDGWGQVLRIAATTWPQSRSFFDDPPDASRAGATGLVTMRADSGFYNHKVVGACRKADVRYSITVRLNAKLHHVIADIPEDAWTPIPYFLDGADVAETTYTPFAGRRGAGPVRLIVRRVRPTPGSQLV